MTVFDDLLIYGDYLEDKGKDSALYRLYINKLRIGFKKGHDFHYKFVNGRTEQSSVYIGWLTETSYYKNSNGCGDGDVNGHGNGYGCGYGCGYGRGYYGSFTGGGGI